MKELESYVIEMLVEVYAELYKYGITKEISNRAKVVYNEFIPADTLLSHVVMSAILQLFAIAYPGSDPDAKVPSQDRIEKIIKDLKEYKQNLEIG